MAEYYDRNSLDELKIRTEYELWLINFFRSRYYGHDEDNKSIGVTELTEGSRHTSGKLKVNINLTVYECLSSESVKKTLQQFIPLVFSTTFKLQDIVVEWILEHNGIDVRRSWRFTEKIEEYTELIQDRNATFPAYFITNPDLHTAFFKLYDILSKFRNVITHGNSFTLHGDGSLEIINRDGGRISFTPKLLESYVRSCCLTIDCFVNSAKDLLPNTQIITSDLAILKPIHNIYTFTEITIRQEKVSFKIPLGYNKSLKPYSCCINMDEVWEIVRQRCTETNIIIFLEVIGITSELIYTWNITPSYVPKSGILNLVEGDTNYDSFLVKTAP
jgi:hypothetical protein